MDLNKNKVWSAGRAPQEELDEIDSCNLCKFIPMLAETCYATRYCHRQMRMDEIDGQLRKNKEVGAEQD